MDAQPRKTHIHTLKSTGKNEREMTQPLSLQARSKDPASLGSREECGEKHGGLALNEFTRKPSVSFKPRAKNSWSILKTDRWDTNPRPIRACEERTFSSVAWSVASGAFPPSCPALILQACVGEPLLFVLNNAHTAPWIKGSQRAAPHSLLP